RSTLAGAQAISLCHTETGQETDPTSFGKGFPPRRDLRPGGVGARGDFHRGGSATRTSGTHLLARGARIGGGGVFQGLASPLATVVRSRSEKKVNPPPALSLAGSGNVGCLQTAMGGCA